MKNMKLITVTALALAAFAFASNSASAQVSTPATDLVLGFEINDATGAGANTNLEIDLGAASLFVSSYTVNSFSSVLGADLTSIYGSNWATRSDLVWGVGGVLGTSESTGFDLTSQVALKTGTSSALASAYGNVGSLAAGTANGTAVTSASGAAVPTGNSNSWTGARTAGSTTTDDFQLPNSSGGGSETTGPVGSIDLYTFVPNTNSRSEPLAVDDGTFKLALNGSSPVFSFNAAPEPSAYALGIAAVLLFAVLRRRSLIA